jgi:hypothetical protein
MLKATVISIITILFVSISFAQPLTGTKTIAPSGDYASFASAITALNTNGVGVGGVVFNITANQVFTENTLPITATGTAANPVIFQKSGIGTNPKLQPIGSSGVTDFGFKLEGADYVTFDGIDIGLTAGNAAVEYGFWFANVSASNGCQNNLVSNCTVTLNKTNTASRGIITQVLNAPTIASGSNSFNKFYNVVITNVYLGYSLNGGASIADVDTEIKSVSGGTAGVNNIGNTTTLITYGIFLNNQSNYTISGQTISNVATSTAACYGIRHQGTLSSGSIFNNTIQSINSSGSGSVYGISISGGAITQHIYSNTISNMSSSTTGGAFGIEASNTGATHHIYSNTIHSISTTAPTSSTNSAYGITNSGANVILYVYKNNIYNISNNGTSGSLASGLNVSGINARIYNNVIFDIKNPNATSTTTAPSTRGITLNTGTSNFYVYHNTVYLGYTATGATNSSTALFVSAATSVDLRNNVFVNNTNISTGARAVAMQRNGTALTMFSNSTDDNLYFAGTPGTKNLIFYDGTNSDQTLFAYQNRMATREWHSVSELPAFVNTTLGTQDLHLSTSVATQCEKGGRLIASPFNVADDFEGNARIGTYVDLGAYEGTYIIKDNKGPYIVYANLSNTTSTNDRTIVATITDPSGVPTSGTGLPTLYWKTAGGTYTSNQGFQSGTNSYTFNFGTPVSPNDSVYYYIVAQDEATIPNVLAYNAVNATGYTASPPAAATAPTNASGYKVVFPIAATINVGTSGADYNSLTNTNGLFHTIKDGVLTQNVTVNILTDLLVESGTHDLIKWVEEEGSNYTITIVPVDASTKLISGTSNGTGLFRLNNIKNVTIDGSFNGSGNYLTFRNAESVNGFTPCFYLQNDASNVTVKNCTIEGFITSGTTQLGTLMIGPGIVTGCDNNSFINNNIRNISTGTTPTNIAIYSIGTSTGINNSNNVFEGNQIFNFGLSGIKTVEGNENTSIINNTFYHVTNNTATNSFGIDFSSRGNNIISGNTFRDLKAVSTGIIAPLFIQNAGNVLIAKNKMYNYPSNVNNLYGIYYAGSSTFPVSVQAVNNQIIINPASAATQNIVGIADESFAIDTLHAYNNSVYIGGNSNSATVITYGFKRASIGVGGSNCFVRNNIFSNTRINISTAANFAISDLKDGLGTFVATNNIYLGTGPNNSINYFERGNGTGTAEDFSNWKSIKRDLSSYAFKSSDLTIANLFTDVATNDFTINNNSDLCWLVNGKGLALVNLADDYNQTNIRSTQISTGATDIGCDEFTTSTIPFPYYVSGSHTLGGTENFSFGGRTLASIIWGSTGTLPTVNSIKHYTGVWPNDVTNNGTSTGARFLNEWFELEATGGSGYTYEVVFNYDSCMLGTIQNEATMQGFKKQIGVLGSWTITGGTSINTTNKLMRLEGQSSFSEFTASDLLAPLPLKLISFVANNNKPNISLQWKVSDEKNNTQFELYRSIDGILFQKIGNIAGTNNATYGFNDLNVFNQFSIAKAFYYKLKIVEENKTSYSNIVIIRNIDTKDWVQVIYPNPFKNNINASIKLNFASKVTANLYQINGKLVKSKYYNLEAGVNTISIDVTNVSNGVCTFELINGTDKYTYQLIKE